MINIRVTYSDSLIKKITVKGHANYADFGKDIVCAGVSACVVGMINAIDKLNKKDLKFISNEDLTEIEFSDSELSQHEANILLVQLQSIAIDYPKNVKII